MTQAKHLTRKSDDAWSEKEGAFGSEVVSTLVFLDHTGREVSTGIRKGEKRDYAFWDLCFLDLKTVSRLSFEAISDWALFGEFCFQSTCIDGWLTVQVSQLRLGLLRRLWGLEGESEAVPAVGEMRWLA